MAKFQRNYKLTIEDKDGINHIITMPLTIDFDVNVNPLSETSNALIRIYNLQKNLRNVLYKDASDTYVVISIELRAGYGEDNLPIIFSGDIMRCFSKREGVDYITTIESYNGQYSRLNGATSKTFEKGTSKRSMIEAIAMDLPNVKKLVIGGFEGENKRGATLVGNSAELLKDITDGGFYIDGDTAFMLKQNECIEGAVNVINANSGLIGSPQRESGLLTFDMIFEPRIRMKQYLKIESTTESLFNGIFFVIAYQHKGMISHSVSGTLVTTVKLWHGPENIEILGV